MEILTVTELTQAIKNQLEPPFSHLQVKGEVTNLRHQASGHLYFSLKDQDAQVSAVLFKGNARHLTTLPKAGDQIIVRGALSLYAPRGSYQIIVRELEHAGVGELLVKLHQLKAELQKRGWLDPSLKKPLPKYPKVIGVVTSPTGSVIQDILHVLKRRFPHFQLILNPVRVQGTEAAREIATAIHDFNTHRLADILIVGRGGGSLEDLWPFNELCVTEAIFHSKIPVISAVGHETDVTLADCVADVRAPTPSAAAEVSVRTLSSQVDFLNQVTTRIHQQLQQSLRHTRTLLEGVTRSPLFTSPYALLANHVQKIDNLTEDLDTHLKHRLNEQELYLFALKKQLMGLKPSSQVDQIKTQVYSYDRAIRDTTHSQLKRWKEKLTYFTKRLDTAQTNIMEKKKTLFFNKDQRETLKQTTFKYQERKKEALRHLTEHLKAMNPDNILKKGYCIPFAEKDHSVMLSTRTLNKGMRLSLRFHDGSAQTLVEEVQPKENGNI